MYMKALCNVLEEWKDKIKIVNAEYHKLYVYDDRLYLTYNGDQCANYRRLDSKSMFFDSIFLLWYIDEYICEIPKRYIFSSGFISLDGFKN